MTLGDISDELNHHLSSKHIGFTAADNTEVPHLSVPLKPGSRICNKEIQENYSLSFHKKAFPFTKKEKLLALASDSTESDWSGCLLFSSAYPGLR